MSLIDSIFGAASPSSEETKQNGPKSATMADLFSSSTSLPELPVYTYSTSSRRSQRKETAEQSKKRRMSGSEKNDTKVTPPSASMEATKEDDDARTIFVGNLPASCTRKQLKHLFSDCGPIQSTRIRCVPMPVAESDGPSIKLPPALAGQQQIYKKVCINTLSTTKKGATNPTASSVIGYVVFSDATSVESALRRHNQLVLDTTLEPVASSSTLGSTRHLRVDRVGGETQLRDPQRTVFLGNLPYRSDEETLHQHILQHMANSEDNANDMLESIRIVRDKETYLCKGFAYVLFKSTQYVPLALRKLHQSTYMKQPLRVQVCGKRTKTSSIPKAGSPSSAKNSTNSSTPNTTAVGALRRVLKKAKTTSSLLAPKKNVRKRGPTSKGTGAANKSVPKKRPSSAQQRGKRLQHKIEKHIQKQRRSPHRG